ncbi:MAG: hypothetical protein KF688_00270 [Pirellulales bacterium]|nr:hypothetical protein [Pirellulales bacterium]
MSRPVPPLLGLPMFVWRLLFAAALLAMLLITRRSSAAEASCDCVQPATYQRTVVVQPQQDSWIFRPGRYTHDPETGARVAQYAAKPAIEPLDDPRLVSSGYTRSRTVLRGADGSVDTVYRVQSYGNGRGGIDAEWERFHDAWRGSTVGGGAFQGGVGFGGFGYGYPGFVGGFPGVNGGFGPYGHRPSQPRYYGYGPGYGQPDPGRLDPDGADGYREEFPYVPDREFFPRGFPPRQEGPAPEPPAGA